MVYLLLFQRFKPVAVATEKYGQFHVGDAYLVLNVSLGSYIVVFWAAWNMISFKSFAICYWVGMFANNDHVVVLYLFMTTKS